MKLTVKARKTETPDENIIRCANNLLKAVLKAGYSVHSTQGCSGFDVHFYDHMPNTIYVGNVCSNWEVKGYTPLKITFAEAEK
jgi:hypothetical protein